LPFGEVRVLAIINIGSQTKPISRTLTLFKRIPTPLLSGYVWFATPEQTIDISHEPFSNPLAYDISRTPGTMLDALRERDAVVLKKKRVPALQTSKYVWYFATTAQTIDFIHDRFSWGSIKEKMLPHNKLTVFESSSQLHS
jgi:hypothetical protein